jgi:hypothetical protein
MAMLTAVTSACWCSKDRNCPAKRRHNHALEPRASGTPTSIRLPDRRGSARALGTPWNQVLDSWVSPTVRTIGPYRFFFYASDLGEPPHIHVERERAVAKFWLEPITLERSWGFSAHELRRVEELVGDNAESFLEAWHEFFRR